jgi:hypothetical protein
VTAAYSFFNVPDYHWYYAPLVFALVTAASWGIGVLGSDWPGGALPVILLMILLMGSQGTVWARRGSFPPAAATQYREASARLVALGREHEPASSLAAAEIGVLGYASRMKMCDWLGLACPETASLLRAGQLSRFLEQHRPDLLLLHEPLWPFEEPILRSRYARNYRLVDAIPGGDPGAAGALVILRRGIPPRIGGAVAIRGPMIATATGPPTSLGLGSFDPRSFDAIRVEVDCDMTTDEPPRLGFEWTNEIVRERRDPYRIELPLTCDGRPRAYRVPVASDPRFLAFGKVDEMWASATEGQVRITSLSLGSDQ